MVNKKVVISVSVTFMFLVILILAGPAEAISIEADTEKVNYNSEEKVIFEVSVEANAEENFETLTLILNGDEVCTFDKDGNIISGCAGMDVELDEKVGYPDIKFDYIITLNDPEEGRYEGFLRVNEENILSKLINFMVREKPKSFVGRKVDVHGRNGDIINLFTETGFENHETEFQMDMREILDNGLVNGAGSVLLTVIGKKDDSTRVELHIRADPINIGIFNDDKIKIKGPATVDYHRTKKGIWINKQWVGKEDPIRIKKDLSSVTVDIDLNDETIDVISNSEEKFKIEDIDITALKIR